VSGLSGDKAGVEGTVSVSFTRNGFSSGSALVAVGFGGNSVLAVPASLSVVGRLDGCG
jgi:hypothetical protein